MRNTPFRSYAWGYTLLPDTTKDLCRIWISYHTPEAPSSGLWMLHLNKQLIKHCFSSLNYFYSTCSMFYHLQSKLGLSPPTVSWLVVFNYICKTVCNTDNFREQECLKSACTFAVSTGTTASKFQLLQNLFVTKVNQIKHNNQEKINSKHSKT